jgi:hypothetical protein
MWQVPVGTTQGVVARVVDSWATATADTGMVDTFSEKSLLAAVVAQNTAAGAAAAVTAADEKAVTMATASTGLTRVGAAPTAKATAVPITTSMTNVHEAIETTRARVAPFAREGSKRQRYFTVGALHSLPLAPGELTSDFDTETGIRHSQVHPVVVYATGRAVFLDGAPCPPNFGAKL